MAGWDVTTPLGTESASQGDDRIREMKSAIQGALRAQLTEGDEAVFPGTDPVNPVYRYRGAKGATGDRETSGDGGLFFDETRNALQRDNGSDWEDIGTLFPVDTIMLFMQASAPPGWEKITSQNDRAIRIVSGGSGGSPGGSILVSTGFAHSHTVNSHTHSVSAVDTGLPSSVENGDWLFGDPQGSGSHAVNIAKADHVHSLSGASSGAASPGTDSQLGVLAYVDVIAAKKL